MKLKLKWRQIRVSKIRKRYHHRNPSNMYDVVRYNSHRPGLSEKWILSFPQIFLSPEKLRQTKKVFQNCSAFFLSQFLWCKKDLRERENLFFRKSGSRLALLHCAPKVWSCSKAYLYKVGIQRLKACNNQYYFNPAKSALAAQPVCLATVWPSWFK